MLHCHFQFGHECLRNQVPAEVRCPGDLGVCCPRLDHPHFIGGQIVAVFVLNRPAPKSIAVGQFFTFRFGVGGCALARFRFHLRAAGGVLLLLLFLYLCCEHFGSEALKFRIGSVVCRLLRRVGEFSVCSFAA